MAFSFYRFIVTEWKVVERTDYSRESCPSSWFIYGKVFGLFWKEIYKNTTFTTPYSFDEVNIGYPSSEYAVGRILKHAGIGSISMLNLSVVKDQFNPKYKNDGFFRYSIVKKDGYSSNEKFYVASGFYTTDGYSETFVILEKATEEFDTPSEALMRASLMGITVDNPNRFRK